MTIHKGCVHTILKMRNLVLVEIDEAFQTVVRVLKVTLALPILHNKSFSVPFPFRFSSSGCDNTSQISKALDIFHFLAIQLEFIPLFPVSSYHFGFNFPRFSR